MTTDKEIKWRAAKAIEVAKLAAGYAKEGRYDEAARWYLAAYVHETVGRHLETVTNGNHCR